jgi:hypothetical protein
LNTLERATGDKTGPVTRFGTPRDGLVLGLTNSGGTFRWSPETEIINRVDEGSLTERLLVFGRRVAAIVTVLAATNAIIRVGFIRKVIPIE